jgi:membrane-associated phospholipid phosphatase
VTPDRHALLSDHRRAFVYSTLLLLACALALVVVGRHPSVLAPHTTVAFVGRFDASVHNWMDDIRNTPTTWLFRFLNVVGGGLVTIPIRAVASITLLSQRRWHRLAAFLLTWAASEVLLNVMKALMHRGRPPGPLVAVNGYSFPSGHAVAGAATALALVLAFFPPGDLRRKWEWFAVGFSFVMAFSRVYLSAHWFSDVVAGVLLGSGIALGSAALVTEVQHVLQRRRDGRATEVVP